MNAIVAGTNGRLSMVNDPFCTVNTLLAQAECLSFDEVLLTQRLTTRPGIRAISRCVQGAHSIPPESLSRFSISMKAQPWNSSRPRPGTCIVWDHPHVAAICPAQLRKPLREPGEPSVCLGIIIAHRHEHADTPHPLALLRPRRKRPRYRTPEPRDERSALH
jgi:hypothetical protein